MESINKNTEVMGYEMATVEVFGKIIFLFYMLFIPYIIIYFTLPMSKWFLPRQNILFCIVKYFILKKCKTLLSL